jgi:cellulose biosynthesis protein BcsQ
VNIVSFFARKGGSGKSTSSFTFAAYVALNYPKLRVGLVCLDPQGDSVDWSRGDEGTLRQDRWYPCEYGFSALWSPRTMPESKDLESAFDVVVVDMPPETETLTEVEPNLWVLVLDSRSAILDTMSALESIRGQGGAIALLPNKTDSAGSVAAKLIRDALQQVKGSSLLTAIPESDSIAKVESEKAPPWRTTWGGRSAGTKAAQKACAEIYGLLFSSKETTEEKPVSKAKPKTNVKSSTKK